MRNSIVAATAAVAALALGTAQAEIKDSTPNGFTIENSQVVPVDAKTAWNALVNDVGQWWPKDHTWWGDARKLSIQPRAGGCFCEINGEQQAWHMTVTFVDPGQHAAHDRRPRPAAGHGPRWRAGVPLREGRGRHEDQCGIAPAVTRPMT